jgi:hypothetical protein
MPRRARLTLRCLREDLALPLPRADAPLDEVAHPLLAKAAERFAGDQASQERIAAIDDQVLFKVKVQRWRGAVWFDGEIAWLVAAGQREEGSPDDFYASLAARERRPGHSTTPSTSLPWQPRPTQLACSPPGKTNCAGSPRRQSAPSAGSGNRACPGSPVTPRRA